MYKEKIAAWGLDKKHKRCHATPILREKRKRDAAGQPFILLFHDWVVDIDKFERFCQRSRIPVDLDGDGASLPPEIRFLPITASVRPLGEPFDFALLRRLFFYTGVHADSCFDRGIWQTNSGIVSHFGEECLDGVKVLLHIQDNIDAACKLFGRGEASTGWAFVRSAFLLLESLIQSKCHHTLYQTLLILSGLYRHGHVQIGKKMTEHLATLAAIRLHDDYPRQALFQALKLIQVDSVHHIIAAFDAYLRDLWAKRLDDELLLVLVMSNSDVNYIWRGKERRDIEEILSRFNERWGPVHSTTLRAWQGACFSLFEDRIEEAEVLSQKFVQHLESQSVDHSYDKALGYYLLGLSQRSQSKFILARKSLNRAMEFWGELNNIGDGFDYYKLTIMQELEYIAKKLGEFREADELQARIERMYRAVEACQLQSETPCAGPTREYLGKHLP
jgi:hypothetical protein